MGRFADLLRDYLDELNDLRQRGASEDSIRDAFLRFLRAAFPRLQQADPILLEKHIPGLRVRGGFADALYGDLIFECKKRLDEQSRAEGYDELERYIRNQRHPEHHLGILTDGELLEVYALREEQLDKVDELRLSVLEADHAHTWLDCYLFHEKHLTPTAKDVALRFGEHSPTFFRSFRILEELWRPIGQQPAAQTKFAEWQSVLSIVYGSQVGDEALFLRHTYLALFARLLAFVVLQRRPPRDSELEGVLFGTTFQRFGLENFVEDDFFTWMASPEEATGTNTLLRNLATRLTASYDLNAIREDLLKELYQELVDPETRHDLGEFYTPDWLAELTLREAGFPPKSLQSSSLLDPSCGSGTFLFTAVRMLRESGHRSKALVGFCSNRLAGIDVHPLAVTIAKTNILLALGKDLATAGQPLALQVFMADTLVTPQPALQENVIRIPVDVDSLAKRANKPEPRGLHGAFELPDDLADSPGRLHAALDALIAFAGPALSDQEALNGLSERLTEIGLINGKGHLWRGNLDLMRWLLLPPTTNSVWRFILRNAYQPELFARQKFHFVVGNPPWLSYRYVKRTDYQKRIRELVYKYGLIAKRQAHLATQMELATLFLAFCADRYLALDGMLGFVMPRSVMTGAKQHAAFRQRYLASSRRLIDCEQVLPLFNVPACVVIRQHDDRVGPRAAAIPLLHVKGVLPSKNTSLSIASKALQFTESQFKAKLPVATASPYLKEIIQGASLAPRCAWFVRPPQEALVVNPEAPYVETDPATERQAKKPWKGLHLEGKIESEFLFATLLSDNMLPFGWRLLSLVVLPYTRTGEASAHLFAADAAYRHGKAFLGKWLRNADEIWKKHRKSRFELLQWINWQNKLANQRAKGIVKLLFNEAGTHVCSCVVDARNISRWRVHQLPVAGFISDYVTYRFETEHPDEAHYLCAVLNAPRVDRAIKPYQTKGAFGAQRGKGERHIHRRPFEVLPIPRYDSRDKRHRQLARLSQRCHVKMANVVADADEKWLKAPIGRLRTELRNTLLKDDLAEIDALVAEILG